MEEQIKSIYQAVLLETGFIRLELKGPLSGNSEKRLAQKILIRMLSRVLPELEIQKMTNINLEEIEQIQMNEFSLPEANMYNLAWRSYIGLMNEQLISVRLAS